MICPKCSHLFDVLPQHCPQCSEPVVLNGRYAIRKMIGRGGMGEVYLAYDERLATEVAIKRLPARFSTEVSLREALIKEARILARLTDNCIVRMFDLMETGDGIFLILEYVCGPSLQEMLTAGYKPSLYESLQIMNDVAKGLEVAHESGVIHRDLKPANFLISLPDEEREAYRALRGLPRNLLKARFKITDFGIAKVTTGAGATETVGISGTPAYMAPEQLRGEKPSAETDVYALGVIAYQLVAGRLPFETENPAYAHLFLEPPPIEKCSTALNRVIQKALAKDRKQRFPSAKAFYSALSKPEGFDIQEPRIEPQVVEVRKKGISREVWIVAALVICVIGVLGGAAVMGMLNRQQRRAAIPIAEEPEAPMPELRGMPSAAELPPVIEAARGLLQPASLIGPKNGKLAWNIQLPTSSASIKTVGVDQTVYLEDMHSLCAARDGKVQWAFNLRGLGGMILAGDGRIWLNQFEGHQVYYCLNRDGKGGMLGALPPGTKPPEAPPMPAYCPSGRKFSAFGRSIDLDNDCSARAVNASDGAIYVATEGPSIYRARAGNDTFQHAATPCTAKGLFPVKLGVYYYCDDETLHLMAEDMKGWSLKLHGPLYRNMVTDSNGIGYYADSPSGSGVQHIHAIGTDAKILWTVEIPQMTVNSLALDGAGNLYMSGSSYGNRTGGRLVCIR